MTKKGPLIWQDEGRPVWGWDSFAAKVEDGEYVIRPLMSLEGQFNGYTAVFSVGSVAQAASYRHVGDFYFRTADDAKAAAQRDYESLVRSL